MELKIKVGASVDASLKNAFKPLVAAAIDARKQITREFAQVPKDIAQIFGQVGRLGGGAYRQLGGEARAAANEQRRAAVDAAKEKVRAEKDAARQALQIARDLERERRLEVRLSLQAMRREHAAFEREQRLAARRQAQEAARAARELDRFATRTSYHSARFLTPHVPIASVARRAASGMFAGMGIDTTFTGASRRNMALEDASVAVSNQARIAGQEVDPKAIEAQARGIQKKYGLSSESAVGGLAMFQKLAGDATSGMQLFEGMAKRSATANIGLEDIGAVAGNVAKALGDVPDKAGAILRLFDVLTVQGTKGAIEISDMARQVAKVTAPARMIEGDAGTNAARLAAIAQISRDLGGSANAMQATTSIGTLMNTFDKSARVKAFEGAGIKLRNDQGLLRDPYELIKAAIVHTDGDSNKMNSFVMDAQAKRAVRGFLSEYNRAGRGEAGVRAMDALMQSYLTGNLTEETRNKNLAQHMGKQSTQAQQLQAELDEVAKELQQELLPVLKQASPHIVKFVRAMADLAAWAVNNPFKAVVAAMAAAILRAGVESVFRKGIEDAIRGRAGTAALGGGQAALAGSGPVNGRLRAIEIASAVMTIAAASVALYGLGTAAIDSLADAKGKAETKSIAEHYSREAALSGMHEDAKDGKISAGRAAAIREELANANKTLTTARQADPSITGAIKGFLTGKSLSGVMQERNAALMLPTLERQVHKLNDFVRKMDSGELRVAGGGIGPETVSTVTGRPGETPEQLKQRIIEEQREGKREASDRARAEETANNIGLIAKSLGRPEIPVRVVNMPDEGSDDPTAPDPTT